MERIISNEPQRRPKKRPAYARQTTRYPDGTVNEQEVYNTNAAAFWHSPAFTLGVVIALGIFFGGRR